MTTPARHWRSYGTSRCPRPAEALDEPFCRLPVVVPANRVRPLRQGASPRCGMTAAAEGRRGPSCCVAVGGIALAGMQGFVALFRQCNRRVNAAGLQPW